MNIVDPTSGVTTPPPTTQSADIARLSSAEIERIYSPIGNEEAYPELPGVIAEIVAEREDRAAYFAMWRFFLRLPFGPFSDLVQREAIRLRGLIHQTSPGGPGSVPRAEKSVSDTGDTARASGDLPSPGEPELEATETRVLWAVRWPDGTLMGPMYSDDGSDYAEQVIRSTADGVGGETVWRTETITRTPWELAPVYRPVASTSERPGNGDA